ncbi:unnamed protein product, partial [Leptidea sinapis]
SLGTEHDIAKNFAQNDTQDPEDVNNTLWHDVTEEMLFSNNYNGSYDDWKMKKRSINDAVSRNITVVLENLLKNYEKSHMGPVSELDMYWRDARLSFLGPIRSLSLSIKMLERIWRPDTYFYNGKHSLTIKAKCPMELRNFPMDRQSCPLILGSYAYSNQQLVYQWQNSESVNFVPGMTLSQFDLISFPYRNFTFTRREGDFSVLQVSFNLQRHTGYFLIQVYVPCILIVVGSGEIVIDDSEWEELIEEVGGDAYAARQLAARRRIASNTSASNNDVQQGEQSSVRLTMERTTQTENRVPRWKQLVYCLAGYDQYRRQRQLEAGNRGHINSVSHIDKAARVLFPASFALLNLFYWLIYAFADDDFAWSDNPINTAS